ncbi:hypothetical protein MA16_Dca002590 [Dendrobium catenatum]|uniref:Uncharacterized protein n=1 Tax=Dendrobium catenatum TaxID=906689 RepID=A0A2I0W0X9_9ASPA|nr:hypothetical protein MA16_Dca002590 [Dendrobium catenatum]
MRMLHESGREGDVGGFSRDIRSCLSLAMYFLLKLWDEFSSEIVVILAIKPDYVSNRG